VTAALVRRVAESRTPGRLGRRKDVRDVIYVDDFVDAVILAAEKVAPMTP